jgi:Pyruvate/2-oxoglutarate dehydrogenase complex, dehydrogenase (E1) component, eukaryotic type, alpha subunit
MAASRRSTKKPNASNEELLAYYRDMLLIRRFQENAGQLYGMGLIGGFCHLFIGQEDGVVGVHAAANEGDQRVATYGDHGHMLACGMDPYGLMAELTRPRGGLLQGLRSLDAHVSPKRNKFYGAAHLLRNRRAPWGAGLVFWRPRSRRNKQRVFLLSWPG